MNSRERMLAALSYEEVDRLPCSFMLYHSLYQRCRTEREFVEQQLALGLDAYVHVGQLNRQLHLRGTLHPAARMHEWIEEQGTERIFCRKIETPAGELSCRVRQRVDWPSEEEFPLFNDYLVPRTEEFLVKPEKDLQKVKYLFGPLKDDDIRVLKEEAQAASALAQEHGLLLVGGWKGGVHPGQLCEPGVMGVDVMAWLSGFEEVMALSVTDPEVIREYARIIHEWNVRQIEVYLDITEADLIIRRGWYETSEFWTPHAYHTIIAPLLRREVEIVHQAGRRFGYIITSAFMPMIEDILDTGIDVLIGLDPVQGKGTRLDEVRAHFDRRRRALWGGVSGAMTVEIGTEKETESAVRDAIRQLGPRGFILSPVDNVSADTAVARRNVERFVATWKELSSVRSASQPSE